MKLLRIGDPGAERPAMLDAQGRPHDSHRYQDGSTAAMIFGVAHLVSYISQFMSLQPKDVISTGTPPCVGGAGRAAAGVGRA